MNTKHTGSTFGIELMTTKQCGQKQYEQKNTDSKVEMLNEKIRK